MKKVIVLIGLIAYLLPINTNAQNEDTRNVGSFTELIATKGVNVTIVQDEEKEGTAHIMVENASVEDVQTENKNGSLKVTVRSKIYDDLAIQVYVYCKNLNSIKAITGASIDNEGVLEIDELEVLANTGSNISLEIEGNKLDVSAVSGKVQMAGTVDKQTAVANTGGDYLADMLESKECEISCGTGGNAIVNVSDKIKAKTSLGGSIICKGGPKVTDVKGNVSIEK